MDVRSFTVGPVAENCYIARRDGADRGLIVDPGDEPTGSSRRSRRSGIDDRRRSCSPTATSTTSAPSRRWPGRPGRRCTAPRSRCRCSPTSCPTSPGPGSGPFESYDADETVAGGEHLSLAGLEIDVIFTPGHSPGHVTYAIPDRGGAVLRRRPVQGLGRAHRSAGRRLGHPAGEHPRAGRRLSRRRRPSIRGTWGSRRSAPSRRRTPSSPSSPGSRSAPATKLAPMAEPLPGPEGHLRRAPGRRRRSRAGRARPRGSCSSAPATRGSRRPIFEDTELFARGVGESTDIVRKEMFTLRRPGRPQHHPAPRGNRVRSPAPTSSTACRSCRSR